MQDMWQRLVNRAYTQDVTAAMLVFIGNWNNTPTELIFKHSIPFANANMAVVTCDTRLFYKLGGD